MKSLHILLLFFISLPMALLQCMCVKENSDDILSEEEITTLQKLKSLSYNSKTIGEWIYNNDTIIDIIEKLHYHDDPRYTDVLKYMGAASEKYGDIASAEFFYLNSLSELSKFHEATDSADLFRRLAIINQKVGNRGEAIRYYEKAIALGQRGNTPQQLFQNYCNMGDIYADLERSNKALSAYYSAKEYDRDLSREENALLTLRILKLNLLYENSEIIDSIFDDAMRAFKDSSPAVLKFQAYSLGGEIFRIKGDAFSASVWDAKAFNEMKHCGIEADQSVANMRRVITRFTLRELDRHKNMLKTNRRFTAVLICVIILLIAVTILITKLNIHNRRFIKLQQKLQDIQSLENNIRYGIPLPAPSIESDIDSIREELQQKLISTADSTTDAPPIKLPATLLDSIRSLLNEDRPIPEKSLLWEDLHNAILSSCPNFNDNLCLLFRRYPSESELRMLELIKAGFRPSQLALLLGRAKGTISNRRRTLCITIFGISLSNEKFDKLIRRL